MLLEQRGREGVAQVVEPHLLAETGLGGQSLERLPEGVGVDRLPITPIADDVVLGPDVADL